MPLRRHSQDDHDDAFAAFAEDVRAAVPSPSHEETARRHLAAMRAAAEEHRPETDAEATGPATPPRRTGARRRPAGPLRPVLRLGAVTAGAVVAFSGTSSVLAAAGVDLPDPVRAPFEAVGIDLPNQPSGDDPVVAPADRPEDGPTPAHREPAPAGGRDAGKGKGSGRSAAGRRKGAGKGEGRPGDPASRPGSAQGGGPSPGAGPQGGQGVQSGTRGQSRGSAGQGNSGRPANPAPRRSARRGAGPARPVKPDASRERAQRRRQAKPVAPPPTVTGSAPAPPPEDGTGTTASP